MLWSPAMPVWESVVTAVAAFAATNVDDILILALFFSQVGTALRRWHVVMVRWSALRVSSPSACSGFAFSFLLPRPYIGLLGILPILLGLRAWFTTRRGRAASGGPGG
jgi:cadmium resistance protein CadD (predicted permease)